MKYFILVPALLVIGCASSGIMMLSEQNNGTELTINNGDKIKVELTSNPSTGYQWIVAFFNQDILQQIGETEFEQETGLLGAPQRQTFIFQSLKAGSTNLILYYLRPWETEASPEDTFQVNILVR